MKTNGSENDTRTEVFIGLLLLLCLISGITTRNLLVSGASGACALLLIRSWIRRWRSAPSAPSQTSQPKQKMDTPRVALRPRRPASKRATTPEGLMDQMIHQGRYALLLKKEMAKRLQPEQLVAARETLAGEMAPVLPGKIGLGDYGSTDIENGSSVGPVGEVPDLFIDRYAVSNEDYKQFVDSGGYETNEHWSPEALDAKPMFVDTTGQLGPRYWAHGAFPRGQGEQPVVGISWYEAQAYARWAGKRLPTSPEWIKAGQAPHIATSASMQMNKYPWGDSIDPTYANLWHTGTGGAVPVHEYANGAVHGIHQLIGNVWEWNEDDLETWSSQTGWENANTLKTIRGGAFDTYLESQATCRAQSGDDPFARQHNIGFRCVVERDALALASD